MYPRSLETVARQRGKELCREAEFRQRHGSVSKVRATVPSQTGRVRRRLGFMLVGAGNRLLTEARTAS